MGSELYKALRNQEDKQILYEKMRERASYAYMIKEYKKIKRRNAFFGVLSLLCFPWLMATFILSSPIWNSILIICAAVYFINNSTKTFEIVNLKDYLP